MAYQITDPVKLAEFDRLWTIARDKWGQIGITLSQVFFAELYNHVAVITTKMTVIPVPSNPNGDFTKEPQIGVSINSWLWIAGAKTVNNNEDFNG